MRFEFVPVDDRIRYRDLLLLADEQWDVVERYLRRGWMWVLEEGDDMLAECVVTDEGAGVAELQSLAVVPHRQGQGLGRLTVAHVLDTCVGRFRTLRVRTGDSPLTVPFYERCGFTVVGRLPNHIVDTYDHPIYEAGQRLVDAVILEQTVPAAP